MIRIISQEGGGGELDPELIKKKLIDEAKRLQIDKIGFASAAPFLELKERLVRHREAGYASGFEEPDIDKRTHPEQIVPEAKSIIAIALAYPSRIERPPRSEAGSYRGMFTCFMGPGLS